MPFTFFSVFAGIGGFDLALERKGFQCVKQIEIDKHCQRVLVHHWPNIKKESDVKKTKGKNKEARLLCRGFPCQNLSVAGKRVGLAGNQSGLFFQFTRLIAEISPDWILVENVPGLLSCNEGRDMATVVGTLAKLGYGLAWRVLDAQYFGLAQRRERLFFVGYLGDARRAAKVLFEPESVPRCNSTGQEKKQNYTKRIAGCLNSGIGKRGFGEQGEHQVACGNTARYGKGTDSSVTDTLVVFYNIIGLRQNSSKHAYETNTSGCLQSKGLSASGNEAGTLIKSKGMVRRLTPLECCRLQGFPDDWLDLEPIVRDTHKYHMLGNAVPVPVVEWIAKRILENS